MKLTTHKFVLKAGIFGAWTAGTSSTSRQEVTVLLHMCARV